MTLTEELTRVGRLDQHKKGEHIFRHGDKNIGLYIIQSGITKAYYTTADGKEFIKSFIAEGQVITCMQSLIESKDANFSLIALEKCHITKVPKSAFLKLLENERYISEINQILIHLALKKEQREYEFLCLSAKERYCNFLQRQASLEPRLTQIDIARYLGITPVALSRIKSKLS